MAEPEIIGDLHGVKVLIERDGRSVILAHSYMPPIKFSIDHPYIQGTRLERDARAVLDAPSPIATASPSGSAEPRNSSIKTAIHKSDG